MGNDEIVVPKTPEQELKQLIEATCTVFKQIGKQKSYPLYAMYRDGELTYGFVMREIELIRQHKSSLSAGKREAVICLVATAIENFQQKQKVTPLKKKEEGTNDSKNI